MADPDIRIVPLDQIDYGFFSKRPTSQEGRRGIGPVRPWLQRTLADPQGAQLVHRYPYLLKQAFLQGWLGDLFLSFLDVMGTKVWYNDYPAEQECSPGSSYLWVISEKLSDSAALHMLLTGFRKWHPSVLSESRRAFLEERLYCIFERYVAQVSHPLRAPDRDAQAPRSGSLAARSHSPDSDHSEDSKGSLATDSSTHAVAHAEVSSGPGHLRPATFRHFWGARGRDSFRALSSKTASRRRGFAFSSVSPRLVRSPSWSPSDEQERALGLDPGAGRAHSHPPCSGPPGRRSYAE